MEVVTNSFHYAGYVYEREVKGVVIYDVEINNNTVFDAAEGGAVYMRHVTSDSNVAINKLCRYMLWKFRHCQATGSLYYGGRFTNVAANLGWITSIIDAEFDFHLCKKITMSVDTAKEYQASQYSGLTKSTDTKYTIRDKDHPLNRASRPSVRFGQ